MENCPFCNQPMAECSGCHPYDCTCDRCHSMAAAISARNSDGSYFYTDAELFALAEGRTAL